MQCWPSAVSRSRGPPAVEYSRRVSGVRYGAVAGQAVADLLVELVPLVGVLAGPERAAGHVLALVEQRGGRRRRTGPPTGRQRRRLQTQRPVIARGLPDKQTRYRRTNISQRSAGQTDQSQTNKHTTEVCRTNRPVTDAQTHRHTTEVCRRNRPVTDTQTHDSGNISTLSMFFYEKEFSYAQVLPLKTPLAAINPHIHMKHWTR